MERVYIAIDLKSFYASVECVERGLNPLTAKLVVADESRTEKTICLAVTPALKELGIPGRARLFEVLRKIKREDFIVATPRMNKYMEISSKIFKIYSKYVSPDDIHVYSIDEVFMDVTNYLKMYQMTANELTTKIINDVFEQTGITATAGIGTNLYLAKIAMDIVAKHMSPNKNGARIAELNEQKYRELLWDHLPLTDFWRVGKGTEKRLLKLGIHTMGELARYSLSGSDKLYKAFGINAELLIDRAWGFEPVEMKDIKNYSSKNHCLSSGQVLSEPYGFEKARLIVKEMADQIALDLSEKNLVTDQIVLDLNYDASNLKAGVQNTTEIDRYGRKTPKSAHGTINIGRRTSSSRAIREKAVELFDKIANSDFTVRRINITTNHIMPFYVKSGPKQLDIFTDYKKQEILEKKEQNLQKATLKIKKRYGKNAILKAMNLEKGATMRQRNRQVGGHRS